jgi:hypothetical protein
MMTCRDVVRDLPLLIYGEASFEVEEELQSHLDACETCQKERHRLQLLLAAVDESEAELPGGLLGSCRRSLRVNVAALAEDQAGRATGFRGWLDRVFGSSLREWLKPAAALTLVVLGFAVGRYVPLRVAPDRIEPQPIAVSAGFDPAGVNHAAERIRFIEPAQDGRIQIVLEETRERVLQGRAGDENIRRLLLAAARESADPGLRVDSVDLLGTGPETDEVRRALLYALQHDSNPGVRLKALDGLRASAADPETRKTLARILLTDDNPGVRTQAIDLLVQKREPEVVGVLQEALRKDDNNYVRLKCQKALHEMRASAESF